MKRVAIIGGGIAGLSAAYDLQKSSEIVVTVIEAAPRFGGKLDTTCANAFTIERAPDSIFTLKPAALDLMCELGLDKEIIEPLGNSFSMLINGQLHPIPRSLVTLRPAEEDLTGVAFLTGEEKTRALAPHTCATEKDISIAEFFRGRFGQRFSELVVEPLLAGIHAGNPEKLSMQALFPSYLKTGTSPPREGALVEGAKSHRAAFVSLKGGMGMLADRLVERLGRATLRSSTRVTVLDHQRTSLHLTLETGEVIEADHVIFATPAFVAAELLAPLRAEAASLLREIRHISTAVVTMSFRVDAFTVEPLGNGFLVPYSEPCGITGCTISSNKWPDRAPNGQVLVRAFLGRDGGPDVDAMTNDDLFETATGAIRGILKCNGDPLYYRLDRWQQAMPQYDLNHLVRMKEIDDLLQDLPVSLVGGSYRGTGIPDCVRQGREAARLLLMGL